MIDPDIRTRLPRGNDVSDPIRSPGAVLTVGDGGIKV